MTNHEPHRASLWLLSLLTVSCAAAPVRARRNTVEVLCRKAWRARAPGAGLVKHQIRRLTVHHSGRAFTNNRRGPARIRSAQRYHQTGKRRWPDIAYHYLIDLRGNIFEGRAVWARGDTGTTYDTTGHFLICVLGNYEKQRPGARQLQALTQLLAWAAQQHKVSPATITSHRDHARTSCPGKHLHQLIKSRALQRRVQAALKAGPLRLRTVCGPAAASRVKAIRQGTR